MNKKNFEFLRTEKKITEAQKIEKSYWSYYFNCDDWSTDDIEFHLRIQYNFGENKVLTNEEFTQVIDLITSI